MSTCGWMKRLDGSEDMRFACIGTCVGGDILCKAKDRGLNWSNVCNKVSFSNLAISDRRLFLDFLKLRKIGGVLTIKSFHRTTPAIHSYRRWAA